MTSDTTEGGAARLALLLCLSLIVLIFAVAAATAIGDYNIPLRTVFLSVTNELGLTGAEIARRAARQQRGQRIGGREPHAAKHELRHEQRERGKCQTAPDRGRTPRVHAAAP